MRTPPALATPATVVPLIIDLVKITFGFLLGTCAILFTTWWRRRKTRKLLAALIYRDLSSLNEQCHTLVNIILVNQHVATFVPDELPSLLPDAQRVEIADLFGNSVMPRLELVQHAIRSYNAWLQVAVADRSKDVNMTIISSMVKKLEEIQVLAPPALEVLKRKCL